MKPEEIQKRIDDLSSERSLFETLWEDLGRYIIPGKRNIRTTELPGEDLNFDLYDNTAIHANELLAAALHGLLTNPNSEWFELITGDDELDSQDHIKKYLQKITTQIHHVLNATNFQTEVHEFYLDLGCFGTATMSIEEDDLDDVRFCTKFIRDVYIEEDSKGNVVELYLVYMWTARQIMSEYGEKYMTEELMKAHKDNNNKRFKVVHAIYPAAYEHGEGKADIAKAKGYNYISKHVVLDHKKEIKESGFKSFPFSVSRWSKASGEKYGRSPGMVALPEAKVLNKMVETTLIGAQKQVDPPLQAPDDGFITDVNTYPGGITFYRAGSQDQIRPIFNNANVDFGFQAIQEKQTKIRDAFYTNQLSVTGNTAQTATEVNQKVQENFRFLGPLTGRQHHEFLRVVVDRVVDILFTRGKLKVEDVPSELKGKRTTARYSSYIAKAQRMGEGQSILQAVQALEPFVNANPNVVDNLDGDAAARRIWSIFGAPQELLHDKKDVEKIRKAKAEAQQEMIAQQQQQQQVDTVAKLSQAGQQQGI